MLAYKHTTELVWVFSFLQKPYVFSWKNLSCYPANRKQFSCWEMNFLEARKGIIIIRKMGTYPPHRSSNCGHGPVYKHHAVHDKNV